MARTEEQFAGVERVHHETFARRPAIVVGGYFKRSLRVGIERLAPVTRNEERIEVALSELLEVVYIPAAT